VLKVFCSKKKKKKKKLIQTTATTPPHPLPDHRRPALAPAVAMKESRSLASVGGTGALDMTGGGGGNTPSHFFVMATGQVEWGQFQGKDDLYCRYSLSYGNDWKVVHGQDTGLSQVAEKGGGGDTSVVWNFPVDVSFQSTNAFGWPRLALSAFGVDHGGRDVVAGYGSVLIPVVPGMHERIVQMYAPQPSSLLQQFRAWIAGAYPEFFDSKFVARSEGRDVTRVRRTGIVKVTFNITTRGMAELGYCIGQGGTTHTSTVPSNYGVDVNMGATLGTTGGLSSTGFMRTAGRPMGQTLFGS
jgi:B9 domain-containing protein 1